MPSIWQDAGTAGKRLKEIIASDIQGLKYLDKLAPLLARPPDRVMRYLYAGPGMTGS